MPDLRRSMQVASLGIAVVALAGCGNASGGSGSSGSAPGGPAAQVGGYTAGSKSLSPVPSPTGPVLHGDGIQAQIVSVGTSAALPGVAAPSGKTALLVRLRVVSDPEGRTVQAPLSFAWSIKYPACENDPGTGCWSVDGGSDYLPEADVRSGRKSHAVGPYGTLDAGSAYFAYIWKFVPESADLHDAKLCSYATGGTCIPLEPVTALAAADVANLHL